MWLRGENTTQGGRAIFKGKTKQGENGWRTWGTSSLVNGSLEFTAHAQKTVSREIVNTTASQVAKEVGKSSVDDLGRVFWAGGEHSMTAAMNFAKNNNMITMEMTTAGKNMQALTKGMPWEKAKPLWTNLSAEFAHGASGTAHVFHNGVTGINIQSVWGVTEYPILQSKGINIIYHVILP